MPPKRKTKWADVPPGGDTPLNAAAAGRDDKVIEMVQRAVDHGEALLAFQPVMQANAPHDVAFYEGLIRVLDPTGRVVPAREFMGRAESMELGRQIDCAALRMGLRTLARNPNIRLSINMSARSIGYRQWMRLLDRGLERRPDIGERLILEITESSAMTVPELVAAFMNGLQKRGISFALDDFGAGVTAFRYFRDFYFDAVKIDGQFVRGLADNPDNQCLVQALVGIARQFDMFTVAESVERREDAELLIEMGVDCLQGYLFGAPTVRPPWLLPHTARAATA
jgi:EAL domain-containing protein (putative c-di-GMP-specific phosphodiesterase class I)